MVSNWFVHVKEARQDRGIQVANIESRGVPKPFHGVLWFLGLLRIISALFVLFAD